MINVNSHKSLKLSKFPFQTLDDSNFEQYLAPNAHWVLPQLSATLARIITPKKVGGLYSFKSTSEDLRARAGDLHFETGEPLTVDHLRGMFLIIKRCPRGSSLGSMKQISDGIRYAANVPLALAALKQYKNIKYSEWDWTDPAKKLFVDKDMVEMSETFGMTTPFSDDVLHWDQSTLQSYQANSRLVKTGKTAGKVRALNSTVSITKTGDDIFDNLPRFSKLALCQTWIFQPSLYHDLMISNLLDLDSAPVPLVDTEVVMGSSKKAEQPAVDSYYEDNLF